MTYETPKDPSPQVKVILHYLDQLKVLNLQGLGNIFTDDFVQTTQPTSLEIPSKTKEEDLAFLQGLADKLAGRPMEVTIYDIIESPGKAWAHVRVQGEPREGKPFDIECIYQFTFAGDSASLKLKALTYFVDSIALTAMG
jgi:hypothetical protein